MLIFFGVVCGSTVQDTDFIEGFPPICGENTRVLILGSMPSETSLRKQQYYGHPRNAFWPIMGKLFGASPDLPYAFRKDILVQQGIAVWDVLKTCVRKGSMDADINMASIVSNDFFSFFAEHDGIGKIFFNGSMAEKLYRQRVLPTLAEHYPQCNYLRLPSTSPAYAAMQFARKVEAWKVIKYSL